MIISKSDLRDQAEISEEEIDQFVNQYKIDCVLRCSAKTGENVGEVFDTLTQIIIDGTLRECPLCHEMISEESDFCPFCEQSKDN